MAQFRGQLTVNPGRIFSCCGKNFTSKKSHRNSVFVGCPYGSFFSQKARAAAFFSGKSAGLLLQPLDKPSKADRRLGNFPAKTGGDAIHHGSRYNRFTHGGMSTPLRPILKQI